MNDSQVNSTSVVSVCLINLSLTAVTNAVTEKDGDKTERKRYATNGWIVKRDDRESQFESRRSGSWRAGPQVIKVKSKSGQARPDQTKPDQVRNARVRAILEFDATRVIPFDGQQGEQYTPCKV